MQRWNLDWAWGRAEVQSLGGMLGPVWFQLPDGRRCQPMHVAPWRDEPEVAGLSPMLQHLQGEWPCVPFGRVDGPEGLPEGWISRQAEDTWDHGYAAHHHWQGSLQADGSLQMVLACPGSAPVQELRRNIRPVPDAPALEILLTIIPRHDARMPVALHPTFRIPAGGLYLERVQYQQVLTYPLGGEDGADLLQANCCIDDLSALPTVKRTTRNGCALPWEEAAEALLLLYGCSPPLVLRYPEEGVSIGLDWSTAAFPDVMLWMSMKGRQQPPWSGRHLALGVEPVNGCFDLGRVCEPPSGHPLQGRGIRLRAGQVWQTQYRIAAW